MTKFMLIVNSFDQDDNTSGFDSTSPNTLQLAEGVHDTGIMEAFLPKTTTKNGQKLTAFLMADDHTRQDDSTLLSVANFNTACSPIPLITGCPKNINSAEVPMTEITTRKGQNLTNFLLDNAPIDCNKNTLFSDALFDPALLPSVPKVTSGINNNIKDVSMVRNTSNNQQKMTELIADDASTNLDNNTVLPTEPPDIDMDDQSILAPYHMKRAHSTQNTKKQIDIRTFGKDLKGQLKDKRAAPAKLSIPYMNIQDIISGKKTFPHLTRNKADTRVMDEEEISILSEQVTPKPLPPSTYVTHLYTSDSDDTMQSHDQEATMERWIPVSPKKKRSKQAPKRCNASDHTEADPWQSSPEQFDHPQPVSKRISFGLPINSYVNSKDTATAAKNIHQTHTNDRDSAKTTKQSGQDGQDGDVTQSYL